MWYALPWAKYISMTNRSMVSYSYHHFTYASLVNALCVGIFDILKKDLGGENFVIPGETVCMITLESKLLLIINQLLIFIYLLLQFYLIP